MRIRNAAIGTVVACVLLIVVMMRCPDSGGAVVAATVGANAAPVESRPLVLLDAQRLTSDFDRHTERDRAKWRLHQPVGSFEMYARWLQKNADQYYTAGNPKYGFTHHVRYQESPLVDAAWTGAGKLQGSVADGELLRVLGSTSGAAVVLVLGGAHARELYAGMRRLAPAAAMQFFEATRRTLDAQLLSLAAAREALHPSVRARTTVVVLLGDSDAGSYPDVFISRDERRANAVPSRALLEAEAGAKIPEYFFGTEWEMFSMLYADTRHVAGELARMEGPDEPTVLWLTPFPTTNFNVSRGNTIPLSSYARLNPTGCVANASRAPPVGDLAVMLALHREPFSRRSRWWGIVDTGSLFRTAPFAAGAQATTAARDCSGRPAAMYDELAKKVWHDVVAVQYKQRLPDPLPSHPKETRSDRYVRWIMANGEDYFNDFASAFGTVDVAPVADPANTSSALSRLHPSHTPAPLIHWTTHGGNPMDKAGILKALGFVDPAAFARKTGVLHRKCAKVTGCGTSLSGIVKGGDRERFTAADLQDCLPPDRTLWLLGDSRSRDVLCKLETHVLYSEIGEAVTTLPSILDTENGDFCFKFHRTRALVCHVMTQFHNLPIVMYNVTGVMQPDDVVVVETGAWYNPHKTRHKKPTKTPAPLLFIDQTTINQQAQAEMPRWFGDVGPMFARLYSDIKLALQTYKSRAPRGKLIWIPPMPQFFNSSDGIHPKFPIHPKCMPAKPVGFERIIATAFALHHHAMDVLDGVIDFPSSIMSAPPVLLTSAELDCTHMCLQVNFALMELLVEGVCSAVRK
ncbi:hypothetical protein DIPPA_29145 [Diplonema papillatum]|nr:hypothetical protein DIPPA_29145 [Diplonema papillatum]